MGRSYQSDPNLYLFVFFLVACRTLERWTQRSKNQLSLKLSWLSTLKA